jgi:drug/metabolite transporter (DMT)-like permease
VAAGGDRVALLAFITGSVFAGGNAVGVRFSNRELEPLWGAGLRFAAAATLLGAVMALLRLGLPRRRALLGALLYGALNFGAAFALAYYALVRLHAGFGQTLLAIVPLATLVLAVLQRQERLRLPAVVGALLAVVGIAVMVGAPVGEAVPLRSVVAAVASALCFAQAAIVVRRFPQVHPVTLNAVGMGAGAVLLLVGSLVAREELELPDRASTWVALAYLVAIGSGVVFSLYVLVIGRWGAARTAYTFVLVPVVTVVLSVWLDDEEIGAGLLLGGLLVLAGVYLGALRAPPDPRKAGA